MASKEFKHLESLLYDYPDMKNEINKRKAELAYPLKPDDENVGGSHVPSNSSPQERYIITLDQDKRLRVLEEQRLQIANALLKLSRNEKEVIKKRYFDRPQTLTWDGIASVTGYSKSQCLRIRDKLITDYGKRLGFL